MGAKLGLKNYSKKRVTVNQFLNGSYGCGQSGFLSCQFFDVLNNHFWYPFWNLLGTPDLPKKQQDEPKRAIRSFKDLKTAFSKPLKNTWFLHVFGSRGIPREPQEAQEDSQEATKELQNLKKNTKDLKDKLRSRVENALSRRSR